MERFPLLRRAFAPLLCIALLLVPLVTDDYTQYILNLVLIYVVIGIGLNFLVGYAGQFAFAHAALMGIGAYTAALLTTRLHVSFWLCLPLAGLVAAAIGAVGALRRGQNRDDHANDRDGNDDTDRQDQADAGAVPPRLTRAFALSGNALLQSKRHASILYCDLLRT